MIGTGLVAIVDGIVCQMHGIGQWDHWNYPPILFVSGALLMGLLGMIFYISILEEMSTNCPPVLISQLMQIHSTSPIL